MSLIEIPAHRPEDIATWRSRLSGDAAWSRTSEHVASVMRAVRELAKFALTRRPYVGVSWGKDSVCVAHLAWMLRQRGGPELTLAHVRVEPIALPHLDLVRDEFLDRFPLPYIEVVEQCEIGDDGEPHATGTLERGFRRLVDKVGRDYVSGIRADESAMRRRRHLVWGASTKHTCAPMTRWSARDVWAYAYAYDLPLHPVYAMSLGGSLDRDHLRVASLDGKRGRGMGRAEWEKTYFGWRLDEIKKDLRNSHSGTCAEV
jgi:phosphoadenosine phosphosulfate reductase